MKRITRNKVTDFVAQVSALRFDNVFNPYTDACPDHDDAEAPVIRRRNLELVLEAALRIEVDSFWIARDLGYRGGRRTGLALTDDVHLDFHARLLGTGPLARATKGPLVAERTAAIVWRMLRRIERPIFLWNVFPLHPHEPDSPMSNRCHTRSERNACLPLLSWLLGTLRPRHIVAIGRDAHTAVEELGVNANLVRHPSYGGQADFVAGLSTIYKLGPASADEARQPPLL
jgi:hypothetical protein